MAMVLNEEAGMLKDAGFFIEHHGHESNLL